MPTNVFEAVLASFTPTTREAVTLSTTLSSAYSGDLCTDDSYDTLCATSDSAAGENWVAVRVPVGSRVGPVAVYNRRDDTASAAWLGTIGVCLLGTCLCQAYRGAKGQRYCHREGIDLCRPSREALPPAELRSRRQGFDLCRPAGGPRPHRQSGRKLHVTTVLYEDLAHLLPRKLTNVNSYLSSAARRRSLLPSPSPPDGSPEARAPPCQRCSCGPWRCASRCSSAVNQARYSAGSLMRWITTTTTG